MAEVLVVYDIQLQGQDGGLYGARACGRQRADGLWEGWIEFDAAGGGTIQTGRETTQPNRADLMYWATGLTAGYLDGALLRTLRPERRIDARVDARARPAFSGPDLRDQRESGAVPAHAVLDPFQVYAEGADVLRGQLSALSAGQLGNIVKAYGLSGETAEVIDRMARPDLVALILAAVEQRVGG